MNRQKIIVVSCLIGGLGVFSELSAAQSITVEVHRDLGEPVLCRCQVPRPAVCRASGLVHGVFESDAPRAADGRWWHHPTVVSFVGAPGSLPRRGPT
jgi:hypothetical protein